MLEKDSFTQKIRVIRDPIHGLVRLDEYSLVVKVMDSDFFQRLRRISQLGLSPLVYPSATHNRFGHSIGATYVFWQLFDHLAPSIGTTKGKIAEMRQLGTAAILLHDVGHGPFSHVSERLFNFHHEDLTRNIIVKSEISDILRKEGLNPVEVSRIISRTSKITNRLIVQLISSQLDADRLDYLSRDAYFTGIGFGNVDLERIMNILVVHKGKDRLDGQAVSLYKGYHTLESFIVTRHLMYQGVYLHKTTRCFELMLKKAIQRLAEEKSETIPTELSFLIENRPPSADEILKIDDHYLYSLLRNLIISKDRELGDIAKRIYRRQTLSSIEISQERLGLALEIDRKIRQMVSRNKLDPEFWVFEDNVSDTPYKPYKPISIDDQKSPITNIFTMDESNKLREISDMSNVVSSISKTEYSNRYYFPENLKGEVNKLLKLA